MSYSKFIENDVVLHILFRVRLRLSKIIGKRLHEFMDLLTSLLRAFSAGHCFFFDPYRALLREN
jgi:hypothetical protein